MNDSYGPTMTEFFTTTALGFVFGIFASIAAWWAVLSYFTPRFEISKLNRLAEPTATYPCGYRYRIKIRNRLRRHGLAELSLHARLVIRGLDKNRPNARTSLLIPVGEVAPFPVLEGLKSRESVDDSERIYTLRIHDLRTGAEPQLPSSIIDGLSQQTIRMEDLLNLGSDAYIRFAATASHAHSGYSRTETRKFRLHDLVEGEFEYDSVEVRQTTTATGSVPNSGPATGAPAIMCGSSATEDVSAGA